MKSFERFAWLKSCIAGVVFACCAVDAVSAGGAEPSLGVLRLHNDDYVTGRFAATDAVDSGSVSTLRWRHPDFATPFEFPLKSLMSLSFPMLETTEFAKGRFAFELANGDRLYGDVLEFGDPLRVRLGDQETTLPLNAVRQIRQWNDGEALVYHGPGSREEWQSSGSIEDWSESSGVLETQSTYATLFRDLQLPSLARVELDVSWEGQPNFVIAVGVDPLNAENTWADAFHIEVWDEDTVAVWEDGTLAGVESIAKVKDLGNRLQVTLKIDQTKRQVMIESMRGKTLSHYTLPIKEPQIAQTGILFRNVEGKFRIHSLKVMHASSLTPPESESQAESAAADGGDGVVHLVDGSAMQTKWTAVQDDGWVFLGDDGERVVPANEIQVWEQLIDAETSADERAEGDRLQLKSFDGLRVTGTLEGVTDDALRLAATVTGEEMAFPLKNIEAVDFVTEEPLRNRIVGMMRLESADTRLHGKLEDVEPETSVTPMSFRPAGSEPSVMLPTMKGKVLLQPKAVTVTTPMESQMTAFQKRVNAERAKQAQQRVAQRVQQQQKKPVWGVFNRVFDPQRTLDVLAGKPIHLKTGEVLPGRVLSINETEVLFKSALTKKQTLPREQIRAIHLLGDSETFTVDAEQRTQLLTVPRNRKQDPPTHLLVAKNGDLMRCRLIRMDEETVEVETRLETLSIPRKVVEKIIWLIPAEDASDEKKEETNDGEESLVSTSDESDRLTVQGVMHDGNRLSLVPNSVINQTLIGENDLLGPIRLPFAKCEELLLGIISDTSQPNSPYSEWKLVNAPEPMIGGSGGEGDAAAGTRSAMVGKPAPDFNLVMLTGDRFRVSDQTGKTLVLDFWATWCGPCLRAMPMIEEAVSEFDPEQVRLVAVNLQEGEEDIRQTLERIGVQPEVALDIDGIAAGRYEANAIPQTVVIDREGNVTRVFVGGGPKLGEQLAEAIRETLE
ncbi:TlpA family protein disulfide reductase [Rhodopirellula sp. JC740]|uniref:TlpA family protein disulfide reductase n=1 Tax=Rhodopirellula halodulae TaxID=2894198 RepID=A0ABS8NJP8_9BACT|nr:TlpA disulfide reductase family protein [Rhodopirellula sp. JC740]MCC9643793.1 TlpA family protein disulfide reductase [Rhodopirellula sp. JC740]